MLALQIIAATASHAFIRLHGRNKGFWYNYLYSKQELEPWIAKVNAITNNVKVLRIYFNNHYGAKAIVNALQFKEMLDTLTEQEKKALEKSQAYLSSKAGLQQWFK